MSDMLCGIPARGGSKRLPRKNVLPLAGRPMIAYSIEAAKRSELFEKIYVCTEDPEIAEIAVREGAEVPYLMPKELCGDLISSCAPCEHLAERLADCGNPQDSMLCLQPSSPLRSADDIKAAVTHFHEGDYDFIVSVTPIDPHYFHWAVVKDDELYWRMYFHDDFMMERQFLLPAFRPNGSIKIAKLEPLKQIGHFFGPKMGVIETPEERSIHVATAFDLELCEFLARKRS